MSLALVGKLKLRSIGTGSGTIRRVSGVFAWNSTDATGTLQLRNIKSITSHRFQQIGTGAGPAADEQTFIDAGTSGGITISLDRFNLPASGQLAIKRTGASKTSGLLVNFVFEEELGG